MADSFGLKIGVEGEKEFKNALSEINQSFKVLGSEMKLVSSEFDKNDKSIEAVTARNSALNKEIDAQKGKISTLEAALKNASDSFGENDKRTQNWTIQLNNAKTALNVMERELANNNKALEDTSEDIKEADVSLEKLGETLEETNKESKNTGVSFNELGEMLKNAGEVAGKVASELGKMVAAGLVKAGEAFKDLSIQSLKLGGDLEQNIGGAEQVFGKFADTIKEKGSTAFQSMGLSMSDFLATSNKMGALFQGAGFSIEESMNLSSNAMQRAADVASIMGIDTSAAMEAIAGAAKGNFTMMDNLGVAMNATTIEAYALSKGIETSYTEMDNAQKIGLAMEMFLEKTAYATGNYAKENETLAGSLGTAKAAWDNFLSGAGQVDDLVYAFSNAADVIIKNLKELLPRLAEGIAELVKGLVPEIPPLLMELLPTVIETVSALLEGVVEAFPELAKVLVDILPMIIEEIAALFPMLLETGIDIVVKLIEGITGMLPELIPVAVDTVLTLVETLIDNVDLLIDASIAIVVGLAEGLINSLPELIDRAPIIIEKLVEAIIENVPKLLTAAYEIVVKLANGIIENLDEIGAAAGQIIYAVLEGAAKLFEDLINLGATIVENVWNGITGRSDWLDKQTSGFFQNLIDGLFGRGKTAEVESASYTFGRKVDEALGRGLSGGSFGRDSAKKLGEEIPEAIADGVEKNANKSAQAAEKMLKSTFDNAKLAIKDYRNSLDYLIEGEIAMWEELGSHYAEMSKERVEADTQARKLREQLQKEEEQSQKEALKVQQNILKVQSKSQKDFYDNAKLLIEDYRNSTNYLASEEIAMWEELGNHYADKSKEKIEIDKNIAKLREQIAKESEKTQKDYYGNAKLLIEDYKNSTDYAIKEEIAMWEELGSRYTEISKEKIEIDRTIKKLRADLNKESYEQDVEELKTSLKEKEMTYAEFASRYMEINSKYFENTSAEYEKGNQDLLKFSQERYNEEKRLLGWNLEDGELTQQEYYERLKTLYSDYIGYLETEGNEAVKRALEKEIAIAGCGIDLAAIEEQYKNGEMLLTDYIVACEEALEKYFKKGTADYEKYYLEIEKNFDRHASAELTALTKSYNQNLMSFDEYKTQYLAKVAELYGEESDQYEKAQQIITQAGKQAYNDRMADLQYFLKTKDITQEEFNEEWLKALDEFIDEEDKLWREYHEKRLADEKEANQKLIDERKKMYEDIAALASAKSVNGINGAPGTVPGATYTQAIIETVAGGSYHLGPAPEDIENFEKLAEMLKSPIFNTAGIDYTKAGAYDYKDPSGQLVNQAMIMGDYGTSSDLSKQAAEELYKSYQELEKLFDELNLSKNVIANLVDDITALDTYAGRLEDTDDLKSKLDAVKLNVDIKVNTEIKSNMTPEQVAAITNQAVHDELKKAGLVD